MRTSDTETQSTAGITPVETAEISRAPESVGLLPPATRNFPSTRASMPPVPRPRFTRAPLPGLPPNYDGDGDGVPYVEDCNDRNATRYPGATEVCDAAGKDEDCDSNTFGEKDSDGDGHIDYTCVNFTRGGASRGTDCDDSNDALFPGTLTCLPEFSAPGTYSAELKRCVRYGFLPGTCVTGTVCIPVHRRYSPYTAFSLASLPHRISIYGLVARLTAALSTGNLDDATGSIDDVRIPQPNGTGVCGVPPSNITSIPGERF
jgi:hypothetical protein